MGRNFTEIYGMNNNVILVHKNTKKKLKSNFGKNIEMNNSESL